MANASRTTPEVPLDAESFMKSLDGQDRSREYEAYGLKWVDNTADVDLLTSPSEFDHPDTFDKCKECAKHFRPLREQVAKNYQYTNDFARDDAEANVHLHVEAIFHDFEYLRDKLRSYGNAIISKWNKKTMEKRRCAVQLASPDLYVAKFPQAHLHYDCNDLEAKRAYRKAYLLPYLTVNTLCDDKTKFLGLLHSRAAYPPQDWVIFDSHQLEYGWRLGSLTVGFAPYCVVMNCNEYGTLVNWNVQDAHAWKIIGWPRACLILEAQKDLMHFLRSLVDILLDDYHGEAGSDKWDKLVTEGLRAPGGLTVWPASCRQAFSAPPKFNPIELLDLAQASLAAVEDDLWLRQTDPAYALLQISNMRKLVTPQTCALKGCKNHSLRWAGVVVFFASLPASRARVWRGVVEDLSYLAQLYQRCSGTTQVGTEMHQYYALAHGLLQTWLGECLKQMVKMLGMTVQSLPGFVQNFTRRKLGTGRDALEWIILHLTTDDPLRMLEENKECFLSFIDEDAAPDHQQDAGVVNQILCESVSDIAAMLTIQCALEYCQPVVPAIDRQESMELYHFRTGGESVWRNCTFHTPVPTVEQCKSGEQALEAFASGGWPKGKRDKVWLQQADSARGALLRFWDAAGAPVLEETVLSGRTKQQIAYDVRMTQLGRTAEHLAQVELERQAILAPKPVLSPPAVTSWDYEVATNDKPHKLRPTKDKKGKRRRAADTPSRNDESERTTVSTDAPTVSLRIEVSSQTIRVFKGMFDSESTEVKWPHFVAAMVEAGCIPLQSNGSAVVFKRQTGSVVVHKPHPDPTINPIMLQSIGKRLKKWFKWERGVFVEKEKEKREGKK